MAIITDFKKKITDQFPEISVTELQHFFEICTYKKLKNKEIIIAKGSVERKAFFILSGVIRGYATNNDDSETNLFIRPDGGFTAAFDQLLEKKPSQYTFASILHSEILCFDIDEFEALCGQFPNLFKIYVWGLKGGVAIMANRVVSMILNTPEQRYENLLKTFPIFFQKAFNKHIANYLGITPVSLSRMIKRIKEREKSKM